MATTQLSVTATPGKPHSFSAAAAAPVVVVSTAIGLASVRKLPIVVQQNGMETARTVNMLVDGHFSIIRLKEWTNAPTGNDLFKGATVLADGISWNPGTGQGVYTYYNSTWNKLG